jgi:hypothetical protein
MTQIIAFCSECLACFPLDLHKANKLFVFFFLQDDPELLEIKPTEDDLIDKDEEMNEDESAEIQVQFMDLGFCSGCNQTFKTSYLG